MCTNADWLGFRAALTGLLDALDPRNLSFYRKQWAWVAAQGEKSFAGFVPASSTSAVRIVYSFYIRYSFSLVIRRPLPRHLSLARLGSSGPRRKRAKAERWMWTTTTNTTTTR